jgi:3-dehydroquinate synthase
MVLAAELSGIGSADLTRLTALIAAAGLPTRAPEISSERWLEAMGLDKKVLKKQLRFVLLRSLGDAAITNEYDKSRLRALIGAAG